MVLDFIKTHNDLYLEMVKSEQLFFFALSSIQVSHFLNIFFYLNESDLSVPPQMLKVRSKRMGFKTFANLLERYQLRIVSVFHGACLEYLFRATEFYGSKLETNSKGSPISGSAWAMDQTKKYFSQLMAMKMADLNEAKAACEYLS